MNKIVIDGKESSTKEELHEVLKQKLNFPDFYGKNLDALWDCLTGHIGLPLTIEWQNYAISQEYLGDYASKILEVFKEAEAGLKGFKIVIT